MPRPNPDSHPGILPGDRDPSRKGPAGGGGRLNLLLSYGGWQHESWVDRLPVLLEPMGVCSLRAGSGREASEVLKANHVHIAIVDLGLPFDESSGESEEAGPRLLELLSRLPEPPPTVVVKRSRTHRDDCRELAAALRAGAFAVIDRPNGTGGVELMLEVLRRCLMRHYRGLWPGIG